MYRKRSNNINFIPPVSLRHPLKYALVDVDIHQAWHSSKLPQAVRNENKSHSHTRHLPAFFLHCQSLLLNNLHSLIFKPTHSYTDKHAKVCSQRIARHRHPLPSLLCRPLSSFRRYQHHFLLEKQHRNFYSELFKGKPLWIIAKRLSVNGLAMNVLLTSFWVFFFHRSSCVSVPVPVVYCQFWISIAIACRGYCNIICFLSWILRCQTLPLAPGTIRREGGCTPGGKRTDPANAGMWQQYQNGYKSTNIRL